MKADTLAPIPAPRKRAIKRKDLQRQLDRVKEDKPIEIGTIRGFLVVVDKEKERKHGTLTVWKCRCVCGATCFKDKIQLSDTKYLPSCGCKGLQKTLDIYKLKAKMAYNKRFKDFTGIKKTLKDKLLVDYIDGTLSIKDYAKRLRVSASSLIRYLENCLAKLHTSLVINKIENLQEFSLDTTPAIQRSLSYFISNTKLQEYLEAKLSPPTAEVLTPSEEVYAYVFAKTGNSKLALSESQFDDCLDAKDTVRKQLLSLFLQDKPNVSARIKEIKVSGICAVDVSKDKIQDELLIQIQQLKDTVALLPIDSNSALGNRGHLLKSIEMLGKTIGSFQDSVKVDHVNSGDVLDKLIEMTKETEVIAVSSYKEIEENG